MPRSRQEVGDDRWGPPLGEGKGRRVELAGDLGCLGHAGKKRGREKEVGWAERRKFFSFYTNIT